MTRICPIRTLRKSSERGLPMLTAAHVLSVQLDGEPRIAWPAPAMTTGGELPASRRTPSGGFESIVMPGVSGVPLVRGPSGRVPTWRPAQQWAAGSAATTADVRVLFWPSGSRRRGSRPCCLLFDQVLEAPADPAPFGIRPRFRRSRRSRTACPRRGPSCALAHRMPTPGERDGAQL